MLIKDLESIYKIFDEEDSDYTPWFGTIDDIVDYLHENFTFKDSDSWEDVISREGLTMENIN